MVDQFVFGFEGFALPGTFLPEADVIALLGAPNMLHGDMVNQFVHGAVSFGAGLFGAVLLIDPLADELLFDGLPHVPQERPCSGWVGGSSSSSQVDI